MPGEHDNDDATKERRHEDPLDEPSGSHPHHEEGRKSRFSRITKVLMDRGEDARSVLGTMWDTSDRARSEMVKIFAREVRNYLDGMKLTEDLRDFATHHTLEVQASFRLKPIVEGDEKPAKPTKSEEPPKE